jgi:hypothetical protein
MLAATRSKDEYSHVTRAYWPGRFGVDGGKAGIRPERKGVMDGAGRCRGRRRARVRRPSHASLVNLAERPGVLNVGW